MSFDIVFVCGIGRSGTHFIARFLKRHPGVHLRLEKPSTFRPIVKMATEGVDDGTFELTVRRLRRQLWRKRLVVEKSHPSLWMTDRLLQAFPNAGFVATQRPVLQVVNSMLNHEGVMRWYDVLPLDRPNKFLGITEENVDGFSRLPSHLKCTWKWISHMKKLRECAYNHPENFRIWRFEDLILSPQLCMDEICDFIGVGRADFGEHPDESTLGKYSSLSSDDQHEVQALVAQHLPEFRP